MTREKNKEEVKDRKEKKDKKECKCPEDYHALFVECRPY